MTLKLTPEEDPFRKFDPVSSEFEQDMGKNQKSADNHSKPTELNDEFLKAYEARIRKLSLEELYEILDIVENDPTPGRMNIVSRRIQQIEADGFDPTRESLLREMEEKKNTQEIPKTPAEEKTFSIERKPKPRKRVRTTKPVEFVPVEKLEKPEKLENPKTPEISRKAKQYHLSEAEMAEILQTLNELDEKYKDITIYSPRPSLSEEDVDEKGYTLLVAVPISILALALLIYLVKSAL